MYELEPSINIKDGDKKPGLENKEMEVLISLCLAQDNQVVLLKQLSHITLSEKLLINFSKMFRHTFRLPHDCCNQLSDEKLKSLVQNKRKKCC